MRFWKEFVRAPHVTGAIAPSSRWLARVIVDTAKVACAGRIVEIGPGTGVFTEEILAKKERTARFVAVERNPKFASHLKSRFPGLPVVNGCASRLRDHAAEHDFCQAESIVSGLPWAIFDGSTQTSILGEIRDVLCPRGVFATFAYFGPHLLPPGQRFRKLLEATFGDVHTSRIVIRNFPPAFVYACRK